MNKWIYFAIAFHISSILLYPKQEASEELGPTDERFTAANVLEEDHPAWSN